jgi:hypothetical protein
MGKPQPRPYENEEREEQEEQDPMDLFPETGKRFSIERNVFQGGAVHRQIIYLGSGRKPRRFQAMMLAPELLSNIGRKIRT